MLIFPLSILFINSFAQDTICTYFTREDVYTFDYKMDSVLSYEEQVTKFYTIKIEYGQVLCLDLSDKKRDLGK